MGKVGNIFKKREHEEAKALYKAGILSEKEMRQVHLKKFKAELEDIHGKGWYEKVLARGRAWSEKTAKLNKDDIKPINEPEQKVQKTITKDGLTEAEKKKQPPFPFMREK